MLAPGREPMSRAEFMARIEAIGRSLAVAGVKRGDVVAMVLPDGINFLLTLLGIASVAACAPLNPASSRTELEFYLGELRPRAVVVERRDCLAAAVASAMSIKVFEDVEVRQGNRRGREMESAESDDTALVLFTSARWASTSAGRCRAVAGHW